MEPPEPPRELWLEIDLSKIRFDTNRDVRYIEEIILQYNPELFTTINSMYKAHKKKLDSCLKFKEKQELSNLPKIMKKPKKK